MPPSLMQMCREERHKECLWGRATTKTINKLPPELIDIMGAVCRCLSHPSSMPVEAVAPVRKDVNRRRRTPRPE